MEGADGIPARKVAANNKMKIKKNGATIKISHKVKIKDAPKDAVKSILAGFGKASKGSILER